MALVGVVDPSHKEQASDTMGRLPNWLTLDEALELSEDPKWAPWTQVLIRAMFAEHQERDYISTSMLVSHCPRAEVLKRKLDYVDDLSNMYVPFRGTMVHRTMELYAGPDDIAEHRFFMTIDGVEVSCSPDTLSRHSLWDYKVTDNPPMYYPWKNHTEQVQVNAYIVRHAERVEHRDVVVPWADLPFDPRENPVTRVGLVYMSPKQPKVLVVEHTEDTFNETTGKFKRGKVPFVWSDRQVEKLIKPRLEALVTALNSPYADDDLLFPLGTEDLWGGDASWRCPGQPLCKLPNCLAKRYPGRLIWERDAE